MPNDSKPLPGAQFNSDQLDASLRRYGFEPVSEPQIDDFYHLADSLIDGDIAGPSVLRRVQAWTGRALHMRSRHGKPNAILASIPLTTLGRDALLSGEFGFANARRDWVCGPGDGCDALLSWGMAGDSPAAQNASVRGLLAGWFEFYGKTPVYARVRSASGGRLLSRLGFEPCDSPNLSSQLYHACGLPRRLRHRLSRYLNSPNSEVLS
jgi:hypothetical protein